MKIYFKINLHIKLLFLSLHHQRKTTKKNDMKTLNYNNREITMKELLSLVQGKLNLVADNSPSQYMVIKVEETTEDDILMGSFKLRVSNHSGKACNDRGFKVLSFVTDTCNQGYSGISDEYIVESIEDMHTNETNMRGWLSIEEVIEDFINDLELN